MPPATSSTCRPSTRLVNCRLCNIKVPTEAPDANDPQQHRTVGTAQGDSLHVSFVEVFRVVRGEGSPMFVHQSCARFALPHDLRLDQHKQKRAELLLNVIERHRRIKCQSCHQGGATVKCQAAAADPRPSCKAYHLPCLLDEWKKQSALIPSKQSVTLHSAQDHALSFTCAAHAEAAAVMTAVSSSTRIATASPSSAPSPSRPSSTVGVLSAAWSPSVNLAGRFGASATDSECSAAATALTSEAEQSDDDKEEQEEVLNHIVLDQGIAQNNVHVQATTRRLQRLLRIVQQHPVGHLSLDFAVEHVNLTEERLVERLRRIKCVVVGRNGVGKTFVLNILCSITVETDLAYRERWKEVGEIAFIKLEAYWDRERDIVVADLLQAIQHGRSPQQATARSGAAGPIALSLDGDAGSSGAPRTSISTSAPVHKPSSSASTTLMPLTDLWELVGLQGGGELSRWSRASWQFAGGGRGERAAGHDLPSQLGDIGYHTVVVDMSDEGEAALLEQKQSDMERWEQPLLNLSWKVPETIAPWLLQSMEQGRSTTSHIYRLRHGRSWHACLRYVDRAVAEQAAYRYVRLMMDRFLEGMDVSSDEVEYARERYAAFVGIPLNQFVWTTEAAKQPMLNAMFREDDVRNKRSDSSSDRRVRARASLPFPTQASELPILPSIEGWLGRSVLIRGKGRDLSVDRIFLRRQLLFFCHQHIARHAILLCSVYAPCTILEDVELWDTPGSEDAVATNVQLLEYALQRADIPLVLLQRDVSANSTLLDKMKEMKLFDRCILSPRSFGHVVFLHYFEHSGRTTFSTLANSSQIDPTTSKSGDERDRETVDRTTQQIKKEVQLISHASNTLSDVAQLMDERMTCMCVYPTLFSSVLMQQRARSHPQLPWAKYCPKTPESNDPHCEPVEPHREQAVLLKTGGYQLCGLLRACVPRICRHAMLQLIGRQPREVAASRASPLSLDDDNDDDEDSDSDEDADDEEDADVVQVPQSVRVHHSPSRTYPPAEAEQHSGDDPDESQEEKKEKQVSGTASSSHTCSGTDSEADDECLEGFVSGSFLSSLAFQVDKFAKHHGSVDQASQRRYHQIRDAALKSIYPGKLSERTWLNDLVREADQLRNEFKQVFENAVDTYECEFLATERVDAERAAGARWRTVLQQDPNLTVAHIDPKYRGLASPKKLRSIFLDHFLSLPHLHVAKLHEIIRDSVQQLNEAIQQRLFRPQLERLIGYDQDIISSPEYSELANRACMQGLANSISMEWEGLLVEDTQTRKQATELSEDRVLLMMRQATIDVMDKWLDTNFEQWKQLLRVSAKKRKKQQRSRQQVVNEITTSIPNLLDKCLDLFLTKVKERVFNQQAVFFKTRLLPGTGKGLRRAPILDSALRSFLTQARSYEGQPQPHLQKDAASLVRRLRRWQRDALRHAEEMKACSPHDMGVQLISAIQCQWDQNDATRGEAGAKLPQELHDLITATHRRNPLTELKTSKLRRGMTESVSPDVLHARWSQAQSELLQLPDFDAQVKAINEQLRGSGEKLGIFYPKYCPHDCLTQHSAKGLMQAVAVAWLWGTDLKCMKEADNWWESVNTVVDFLYHKCAMVMCERLQQSEDGLKLLAQLLEYYHCEDKEAIVRRLEDRSLPSSAALLHLLATAIRCKIVVWDQRNITRDRHAQQLMPIFHVRSASTPSMPCLHLAFLPRPQPKYTSQPHSTSLPSSSLLHLPSFCVVPLFRVHKTVQISEQVMTRTFHTEPSPLPRDHASPPASRAALTPATSTHPRRPALPAVEEPQLKKLKV